MSTLTAPRLELRGEALRPQKTYESTHARTKKDKDTPKELVFNRNEKKYLVDRATIERFKQVLGKDLIQDERGSTCIRNLYLDTPDHRLIRRSIEKPLYKEKLRIRTYNTVLSIDHEAFVEIKKKFDGQVYKRRLVLPLAQAKQFVEGSYEPQGQIARELAFSIASYKPLEPAVSVIYKRTAYVYPGLEGNVRITFDCNLAAKQGSYDDFLLPHDSAAYCALLSPEKCVMEIKVLGAIPLELTAALSALKIYPQSFSKVGTAFTQLITQAQSERSTTHVRHIL